MGQSTIDKIWEHRVSSSDFYKSYLHILFCLQTRQYATVQ